MALGSSARLFSWFILGFLHLINRQMINHLINLLVLLFYHISLSTYLWFFQLLLILSLTGILCAKNYSFRISLMASLSSSLSYCILCAVEFGFSWKVSGVGISWNHVFWYCWFKFSWCFNWVHHCIMIIWIPVI